MHIYQNVCELAMESGTEGQVLLKRGMNELKRTQADIMAKNNGKIVKDGNGLASMSTTSRKKIDKRIQSRCSPQKKEVIVLLPIAMGVMGTGVSRESMIFDLYLKSYKL